jgi:ectoine hydroxylase-related dioxygenase (phytanoyl-CoA dioxygenase family)
VRTTTFEVRLSEEQVEQFHTEGYTWVPRITTDEELEWLGPIYDSLFATKRGAFKGGYFDLARPYESDGDDLVPQVLAPEVRHPELRETNIHRNALAIGAQLLGLPEAACRTWSHMILKPPHVGGPLPWHQDEAYWDTGFAYRALGVWVPLDPATVDSGCMHSLPRSHTEPIRPHRHIDDDPTVHGLETVVSEVEQRRAVAVPLEPGGATFHHCRTLHMTTPNTSDRVRRAWSNEIQVEPRPLPDDARADFRWVEAGKEAWAARDLG